MKIRDQQTGGAKSLAGKNLLRLAATESGELYGMPICSRRARRYKPDDRARPQCRPLDSCAANAAGSARRIFKRTHRAMPQGSSST